MPFGNGLSHKGALTVVFAAQCVFSRRSVSRLARSGFSQDQARASTEVLESAPSLRKRKMSLRPQSHQSQQDAALAFNWLEEKGECGKKSKGTSLAETAEFSQPRNEARAVRQTCARA